MSPMAMNDGRGMWHVRFADETLYVCDAESERAARDLATMRHAEQHPNAPSEIVSMREVARETHPGNFRGRRRIFDWDP